MKGIAQGSLEMLIARCEGQGIQDRGLVEQFGNVARLWDTGAQVLLADHIQIQANRADQAAGFDQLVDGGAFAVVQLAAEDDQQVRSLLGTALPSA